MASPSPRQISRAFKVIVGITCLISTVTFFMMCHRPNAGPALRDIGDYKDQWWLRERRPAAPPPARPMTTPARIVYQRPIPTPAPTPCEECKQRIERYRKALASDIAIKERSDTLVTPQVENPSQQPSVNLVSTHPALPHTVLAWTWIYATLMTGISSDHPGDVLARVSQDVKDSVTQSEVLIPQGATLHGYQNGRNEVDPNDTSLLVEFDTLTMPNGAEVPLPKAPAANTEGYPGLQDQVDRHRLQAWGPAMLIAAITAGTALAETPTYGGYQGYNGEQYALGAGAASLSGMAKSRLANSLNTTKPTITIRPGYVLRILVNRDLTFEGAYR